MPSPSKERFLYTQTTGFNGTIQFEAYTTPSLPVSKPGEIVGPDGEQYQAKALRKTFTNIVEVVNRLDIPSSGKIILSARYLFSQGFSYESLSQFFSMPQDEIKFLVHQARLTMPHEWNHLKKELGLKLRDRAAILDREVADLREQGLTRHAIKDVLHVSLGGVNKSINRQLQKQQITRFTATKQEIAARDAAILEARVRYGIIHKKRMPNKELVTKLRLPRHIVDKTLSRLYRDQDPLPRLNSKSEKIERVKGYLEEFAEKNPAQPVNLKAMARSIGIDYSYARALYDEIASETPAPPKRPYGNKRPR